MNDTRTYRQQGLDSFYHRSEIISGEELYQQIRRVAAEINQIGYGRFSDKNIPLFLTVLTGGIYFTGKIMDQFNFPCEFGYIGFSRYGPKRVGEEDVVAVNPDTEFNIEDRVVILLDDIWDEGATISHLKQHLLDKGAKQVLSVCMLKKVTRRPIKHAGPDFYAMQCPDAFIYGSGLDVAGMSRNLPGIYVEKHHE
jgi:hypoxanthine phosphoribosyltransferase